MDITYPTAPTLTTPVMQELLALTIPTAPTLQVPAFEGVIPLKPDNTTISVLPFVYAAYAATIQDDIDGRITTLTAYTLPTPIALKQWRTEKEKILRTYEKQRRDLFRAEGAKNHTSMPGHLQRALLELSLAEKRELADMTLKLLEQNVSYSVDTVDFALNAGIESDAVRFDSHHRLQSVTLDAAVFIVKAGFDAVAADIDNFNQSLTLAAAQLQQDKNEAIYQLQLLAEFEAQIKAAGLTVEEDSLLMGAWKAGVDYVTAKAGMQLSQYQVYLIQAEIRRNQAQLNVAESELSLARMQGITAQYETYKAQASITMAQLKQFEIQVNEKKTEIEVLKVKVEQATSNVQNAISLADANVSAAHEVLQVARENLQSAVTSARAAISDLEATIAKSMTLTIKNVIEKELQAIDKEAQMRSEYAISASDAVRSAEVQASILRMQTDSTQYAAMVPVRQMAMIRAAHDAADAKVRSDFYHINGDQA